MKPCIAKTAWNAATVLFFVGCYLCLLAVLAYFYVGCIHEIRGLGRTDAGPMTICHIEARGDGFADRHTRTYTPDMARRHLAHHDWDYRGACEPGL